MKANELMIGDWVRGTATLDQDWYGWQVAPGECIQVRSILHTGINYESNGVSPSFEDDTIRFDDIEPIPITPEILEKNGFRVRSAWAEYEDDDCTIELFGANIRVCNGRGPFFRGKWSFVHELQHALRLCGIDKEIEL